MGTDIHMLAEVRKDGRWQPAYPLQAHEWRDGELGYPHPYNDRNYDLFAMLADVRNGYGFAGIPTGAGFVPLAPQRGLPTDLCDEYRALDYELGDHSQTWVTLAELLDYDWSQTTIKTGVVDAVTYARWRQYTEKYQPWSGPESYSGAISGGRVRNITNEEMDAVLATLKARTGDSYARRERDTDGPEITNLYTSIEWEAPYAIRAGTFYTITMPKLQAFARSEGVSPIDVRLVFGFDS